MKREAVKNGAVVAAQALGTDGEKLAQVIQSFDVKRYAPNTGQVADFRAMAGLVGAGLFSDQGTMHRHGLRGIFDAARCAKPSIRAQGVAVGAVTAGLATDLAAVPGRHTVEQAHASLVGNAAGNSVVL
jgi:hypothetical protein